MLNRRTFVADARPNAGLGLRAVRRITGGDPGIANAWIMPLAEIEAVKLEALPTIADPAAGTVGMGKCDDPRKRQRERPGMPSCPHYAECLRTAISGADMVCKQQDEADEEQAIRASRRKVVAEVADLFVWRMARREDPATFAEVSSGINRNSIDLRDEWQLSAILRDAWRLICAQKRIVAIGVVRPERGKERMTWALTGEEAPPDVPRNPGGRKQKHVLKVLDVLAASPTAMTFREVNAVLDLPGSLVSNCLTRLEGKGTLARRKRGDLWEYWIKDREDKHDAHA